MATKLYGLEADRRDAILNAALKEFAQKGYDDASTNVIAKEAGISKPLMFHYVGSKQALFLFVYDYFSNLLNTKYFLLMDFNERDIFKKLQQSYLLQIKLLKKHPWIFEFNKLSAATQSDEINSELEKRRNKKNGLCYPKLFDKIDESRFRPDLDIEKCKQIIFWSNIGFTSQILEDVKGSEYAGLDFEAIMTKLDGYLKELKKIFYKKDGV